ncbi:hypothetical protein RFI_29026 [Reticulomyxa filosa]|uniref:SAM domain-containing protein n=1 Tax=Reticulomyxa filosa TaxID=46433 RepID=X6M2J2_RETFI|nr:hypothetical protein RFI_29026 [Reticulomyxa filosa]|eukprot:ETO08363.1 hypothetical protein RFI_29026 [Reticulomyxa filosa]
MAQTQALKEWLESNKFGQFYEKMCESGVETLDDLRVLQTENEIMELAGPSGINMGVVFRRKFMRAVLNLSQPNSDSTQPSTEETVNSNSNNSKPVISTKSTKNVSTDAIDITGIDISVEADMNGILSQQERQTFLNKKKNFKRGFFFFPPPLPFPRLKELTKQEQQALNDLVSTIKEHTQQLRVSRDDLVNVKKQAEDIRQKLEELFNKAMTALITRRKQLENALYLAETETTERLKKRVADLKNSGRELLKCKETIEEQFKNSPSGSERQQFVISSVENSLKGCPPKERGRVTVIFDKGDTPLLEVILFFILSFLVDSKQKLRDFWVIIAFSLPSSFFVARKYSKKNLRQSPFKL